MESKPGVQPVAKKVDVITATREEIIEVFKEWNRRYLNEPRKFTLTYDDAAAVVCADYFLDVLAEKQAG